MGSCVHVCLFVYEGMSKCVCFQHVCIDGLGEWVLLRGLFYLLVNLLVALALLALAGFANRDPELLLVVVGILPADIIHVYIYTTTINIILSSHPQLKTRASRGWQASACTVRLHRRFSSLEDIYRDSHTRTPAIC